MELFAAGLVAGIQDLGGAGLSCATSELASAGDGGMYVELDQVPLRDSTLSPEEILMSESQERMMAVVEPKNVEAFLAICRKWDVLATVIGDVTTGDRLRINWRGERVVDVPPRTVAHEGPVYERPYARPAWQNEVQSNGVETLARPTNGEELAKTVLTLVGVAQPVRQVLGDRPVRPLRPGQLGAGPAGGRRRAAHRRGDQPGHRAGHRRQRPVLPASTPTPGPSWPWPRRTATSRSAAPSRWRSPTA